MAANDYIVIRTRRATHDDVGVHEFGGRVFEFAPGPADLVVEDVLYQPEDEAEESRKYDGIVAAPARFPVRLIAPLESSGDGRSGTSGDVWGLDAVGAARSRFTGDGISVAILDTGIDVDHPAFEGVDIVSEDFTTEGVQDDLGHGTHCAGTLIGRPVDGRRIGVATGVTKLYVAKVLSRSGRGDLNSLIKGLRWARDRGAQIISMSIGIDYTSAVQSKVDEEGLHPRAATSWGLREYRATIDALDAVSTLIRANERGGPLVVAAVGNDSRRGRRPLPHYAIHSVPPATSQWTLSVGALAQDEHGQFSVADFSNTFPNLCGPGVNVISANTAQRGGGLTVKRGTSMAAPYVAGVAALWAQQIFEERGEATTDMIRSRLVSEATYMGPAKLVGAGLVQGP